MNEIKMSDIPIGNKMVVKGGWIAYIPSVRPDSPEWAAYFLRYKGPRGALEHLQKVVNNAVVVAGPKDSGQKVGEGTFEGSWKS